MNLRFGVLVPFVVALAACSTSSNSNITNPLAGVTIINPTPTPVPTPTFTPAPTATNVIVDGGFETEGAAKMTFSSWLPCSYLDGGTPALTSGITADVVSATDPSFTVDSSPVTTIATTPDTGTYAALTYTGTGANDVIFPPNTAAVASNGKGGANGICQTFVVPQNAMLTMNVNEGGYESKPSYGDQEADLFVGSNTSGTPIPLFDELVTQAGQASNTATDTYTAKGPYALTGAPYSLSAGQTVTLFIGTYDSEPDAKYGEYMLVDNVAVVGTPVTASAVRHHR